MRTTYAQRQAWKKILEGGVTPLDLSASEAEDLARDFFEMELEQERAHVQLAGCGAAAMGAKEVASKGAYGWSASYQDVVDLRRKFEEDEAMLKETADLLIYLHKNRFVVGDPFKRIAKILNDYTRMRRKRGFTDSPSAQKG